LRTIWYLSKNHAPAGNVPRLEPRPNLPAAPVGCTVRHRPYSLRISVLAKRPSRDSAVSIANPRRTGPSAGALGTVSDRVRRTRRVEIGPCRGALAAAADFVIIARPACIDAAAIFANTSGADLNVASFEGISPAGERKNVAVFDQSPGARTNFVTLSYQSPGVWPRATAK
jgi:hypothetical protein